MRHLVVSPQKYIMVKAFPAAFCRFWRPGIAVSHMMLCENTFQRERGYRAPDGDTPDYKTRNSGSRLGAPHAASLADNRHDHQEYMSYSFKRHDESRK
jgi:hypothetical protein